MIALDATSILNGSLSSFVEYTKPADHGFAHHCYADDIQIYIQLLKNVPNAKVLALFFC